MIVIFMLISVIFLMALVAAPLGVIAVSLAVWGRRDKTPAPGATDLAPAAPAGGPRPG